MGTAQGLVGASVPTSTSSPKSVQRTWALIGSGGKDPHLWDTGTLEMSSLIIGHHLCHICAV